MSLRLTKEAADFFSDIQSQPIKGIKFMDIDKFYACLMLGLHTGQIASTNLKLKESFLSANAKYPEPYHTYSNYLLGLLIDAEIRRRQLNSEDRDLIEAETVKLFDSASSLGLSDKGLELMNRYAAKGFEILLKVMDPPHSVDDFLIAYADLWRSGSDTISEQAS